MFLKSREWGRHTEIPTFQGADLTGRSPPSRSRAQNRRDDRRPVKSKPGPPPASPSERVQRPQPEIPERRVGGTTGRAGLAGQKAPESSAGSFARERHGSPQSAGRQRQRPLTYRSFGGGRPPPSSWSSAAPGGRAWV